MQIGGITSAGGSYGAYPASAGRPGAVRAREETPAPAPAPETANDPFQNLIDLAVDITTGNPFPGTDPADLPPTDPLEFLVWLITRAIEQRKANNATLFYTAIGVGQQDDSAEGGGFTVADLIKPIEEPESTAGLGLFTPGFGLQPTGRASSESILRAYSNGRNDAIARFVDTLG